MGHKVLRDHAHVFCQMFMGWRMGDDLNRFAALPNGKLEIDILEATCDHTEVGRIETHIAPELRGWFMHRLREHRIPLAEIAGAKLTVEMKKTLPSPRKRGVTFEWTCDSTIITQDREYSAHLSESHTWIPNG